IRFICLRYYDGCHAVAHAIDIQNRFGPPLLTPDVQHLTNRHDSLKSLSAIEIRHSYEGWDQRRRESPWR
ncbi:uncharacterized protein EDB91DRAFT_1034834, partial [Suillus paluster]|uniref:uncharacterized protein n=1 Tax=Suillus paluster TaxID=48578 RepID=UPI001B8857C4